MANSTVGEALRTAARDHGSVDGLVWDGGRMHYAAFDREVDRVAHGLIALGIGKGDHVGIWMPTSPEWLICFCAGARIGAVMVPVNTRYRKAEAEYIIAKSDLKLLFTQRTMWTIDNYRMLLDMAPDIASQQSPNLELANFPRLRTIVVTDDDAPQGTMSFKTMTELPARPKRLAAAEKAVHRDSDLLICFTSGSTGHPKGVLHTHRVLDHIRRISDRLRIAPGDGILVNWPMHHVSGLFLCLLPAIDRAARQILMPQWEAESALRWIDSENVKVFGGISTHFFDLVEQCLVEKRDIASVESTYIGGATLPREMFDRILRTLKLDRLMSTYGMTENTVCTTFNHWDDPVEICAINKAPVLTEGEVRIVDPDTRKPVLTGEQGEIWCSGPTVMKGYYKNPEATRETITEDGWLRTGDVGCFDEFGYLCITGRIKDIMKIGGSNVAPTEVENFLLQSKMLKAALVVGVPDPRLGEVGYAYVIREPGNQTTEQDIIDHCRPLMADYKVPRYVRFIDTFPLLSTGKIDRKSLVAEAREHALAQTQPATEA